MRTFSKLIILKHISLSFHRKKTKGKCHEKIAYSFCSLPACVRLCHAYGHCQHRKRLRQTRRIRNGGFNGKHVFSQRTRYLLSVQRLRLYASAPFRLSHGHCHYRKRPETSADFSASCSAFYIPSPLQALQIPSPSLSSALTFAPMSITALNFKTAVRNLIENHRENSGRNLEYRKKAGITPAFFLFQSLFHSLFLQLFLRKHIIGCLIIGNCFVNKCLLFFF